MPLLKDKKSEYFDLNNKLQLFIKEHNANYESLNELLNIYQEKG